jgi:hypothetical protein
MLNLLNKTFCGTQGRWKQQWVYLQHTHVHKLCSVLYTQGYSPWGRLSAAHLPAMSINILQWMVRVLTSAPIDGDWRAPHQNTVSHVDPHAPLAGLPPGEGEYVSWVMSALKGHCGVTKRPWTIYPRRIFRDLKSLLCFVSNFCCTLWMICPKDVFDR